MLTEPALLQAFGRGDYAAVAANAPTLLAAQPDDTKLRLALADSYARLGRGSDAIPQYEDLLGTEAETPAVLGLSAAWRSIGREDRAEGVFQEALNRHGQRAADNLTTSAAPLESTPGSISTQASTSTSTARPSMAVAYVEVSPVPLLSNDSASASVALQHDTPLTAGPVAAMAKLPKELPLGGAPAVQPVIPPTETETVIAAYQKGDYAKVSRSGPAVLAKHPDDTALRMAVANSLAWSGWLEKAIATYEPLRDTPDAAPALIGIANCWRWLGRPDKAADALADAQRIGVPQKNLNDFDEAQRYVAREVRPSTRVSIEDIGDSTGSHRLEPVITQTWRDASNTQIYEVHADAPRVTSSGVPATNASGAGIAYENIGVPLAPRIEAGYSHGNATRFVGDARVKLGDVPWYIDVGRVDWGQTSFSPGALKAGLMANKVGLQGSSVVPVVGTLRVSAAWYGITDGNHEYEYNAELTPALQPLPTSPFKWFVGTYGRKASTATALYWSPSPGFYVATAGIKMDWTSAAWQVYGAVQGGVPLTSASSTVWSVGGGVRRWIGENWLVGGAFSVSDSSRNDSRYRANQGSVFTEHRW